MYCKHCGEKMYDAQTECLKCGTPVSSESVQNSTPEANKKKKRGLTDDNRMLVIVICALAGCFGAHHFYMGETKKGFLKILLLFCLGLSCLLALFDLLKIFKKEYVCSV